MYIYIYTSVYVRIQAPSSLRPEGTLMASPTDQEAGLDVPLLERPSFRHFGPVYMSMCMYVYIKIYTYMAANQEHWPCNRLGRPFRDKGL